MNGLVFSVVGEARAQGPALHRRGLGFALGELGEDEVSDFAQEKIALGPFARALAHGGAAASASREWWALRDSNPQPRDYAYHFGFRRSGRGRIRGLDHAFAVPQRCCGLGG